VGPACNPPPGCRSTRGGRTISMPARVDLPVIRKNSVRAVKMEKELSQRAGRGIVPCKAYADSLAALNLCDCAFAPRTPFAFCYWGHVRARR
jgi:hypothetical protein